MAFEETENVTEIVKLQKCITHSHDEHSSFLFNILYYFLNCLNLYFLYKYLKGLSFSYFSSVHIALCLNNSSRYKGY